MFQVVSQVEYVQNDSRKYRRKNMSKTIKGFFYVFLIFIGIGCLIQDLFNYFGINEFNGITKYPVAFVSATYCLLNNVLPIWTAESKSKKTGLD